jgi:alanine dehydrogenase
MFILGIPKEIKENENRVSLVPDDIKKLNNCKIYVEENAGINSNYTNKDYIDVGAIICNKIELYEKANLIIKVKEPQESEYKLINNNHIVFTFFHFGGNKNLLKNMINSKSLCIAYETIKDINNNHPILSPMSRLAGENAVIEANKFYKKDIEKIVTIIGVGNVGKASLEKCLELGYKNINLLDINYDNLEKIKKTNNLINIYKINTNNLNNILKISNIVIGCIYVDGKETDKLIDDNLLNSMPDNSLFIDVSIDQGGMTSRSKMTTYDNPIYKYNKVNLFCVANIPSIYGNKASKILSNSIYKYVNEIINLEKKENILNNNLLKSGINLCDGIIYNKNLII